MTSNRHWPNLFKVKPQHQWHQITTSSNISTQNSSSNEGNSSQEEERNPDPKPRWNPKPEQIRILESIFNSGMVNPPREEIQKIRIQLQEYGQVGDANVFYWFQNRKSRTKQKQRHLQASVDKAKSTATSQRPPSSFDRYSNANGSTGSFMQSIGELSSSTLPSFSMHYLGHHEQQQHIECTDEYLNCMQVPATAAGGMWNQGIICPATCSAISGLPQPYSTYLLNEAQAYPLYLDHIRAAESFKSHQNLLPSTLSDSIIIHAGTESPVNNCNASLSTVFINDVPFDAPMAPINIKALFGENAVLVHSSGQPVLVDEQGFTMQGLQQGAMYYLVHV